MKLLFTSAGINNKSIHDALVDMLDKPIADSNACASPPRCTDTPGLAPASKLGSSSAGKKIILW